MKTVSHCGHSVFTLNRKQRPCQLRTVIESITWRRGTSSIAHRMHRTHSTRLKRAPSMRSTGDDAGRRAASYGVPVPGALSCVRDLNSAATGDQ